MNTLLAGDEAPWPVKERSLLTAREQALYQRLVKLYPEHKIFIQVALSQLIDVDRHHPRRESIRARYKQLVADFVLCRPDLGVVAVIELDDRTHLWAHRRRADARKTKALGDAGIRLVRIPAGAIPSEDALRDLINDVGTQDRAVGVQVPQFSLEDSELRLAETVSTYTWDTSERRDRGSEESRAINLAFLKIILVGAVIAGGWFTYTQYLPAVAQRAIQSLALPHVRGRAAQTSSAADGIRGNVAKAAMVPRPPAAVSAGNRSASIQAETQLQRQKAQAWLRFYSSPATCERPVDWSAQVECGNQYMRAKKRFEAQREAEHARIPASGSTIVLDNGSVARARN